jgi:hypothetical protein
LHLLAELEVEGAEGFVEEEYAGPVDEGVSPDRLCAAA